MQVIGTIIVVALSQWYLIFPALVMIVLILIVRAAYIKVSSVSTLRFQLSVFVKSLQKCIIIKF